MSSVATKTVVLVVLPVLALACGGGGERRPARAPAVGTTQTTSAALTVSSTPSSPSTNATMAPAATPAVAPPRVTTVETASAVMRVTTARCDREAECSHVGTGKSFGGRDECVNEVGHYVVATLPSQECPGGVDTDALSTCVRDVQAEPCAEAEASAAAVERLTSCSRERLCASPF